MVTCCLNRQGKIKRMLSKKSQYAFKALMYLAQNTDKGPVLIAEIARKKKIPLKFLENILLELKKAGVLESKKGKGGGYFFWKGSQSGNPGNRYAPDRRSDLPAALC